MNLNLKLGRYRTKLGDDVIDAACFDDDELAPVMPAIDAVQQLMDEENRIKSKSITRRVYGNHKSDSAQSDRAFEPVAGTSQQLMSEVTMRPKTVLTSANNPCSKPNQDRTKDQIIINHNSPSSMVHKSSIRDTQRSSKRRTSFDERKAENSTTANLSEIYEDDESFARNSPFRNFVIPLNDNQRYEEYEFIPKSVILDVYSNDPEVKRFLKQLPKLPHESGLNEQDYKCYSCRRPIGLVFGQPRLCHFDGHLYCQECHLGEKTALPARILCNWDFNKYPVSKRNQHFLTLISNESMFELKKIAPLLYKMCPELRSIEDLRQQAFFVRSYCTTCVQDSISFELTKLIWPREHLIKQTDIYSLEDLIQIKNGSLKQVLKNVITFGRQHILSCMLCCQKGFICELCKSSQIIYPFDIESVHRCNECQSIYHKSCFKSKPVDDACPRCQRLRARRHDV